MKIPTYQQTHTSLISGTSKLETRPQAAKEEMLQHIAEEILLENSSMFLSVSSVVGFI